MNVEVRVTQYDVSCFPADHPSAYIFTITVEWRGNDLWAVTDRFQCLDVDGNWDYEPSPSSRDDDWKARHRFPLETALALAQQHAPLIVVNGWTVTEVLARPSDV